ncbi:MAG: hypothetical protein EA341_02700 [Mongoliibacter sp.]|uniref:murein L,D-transpeptidase catalytic domain family protein n=1 Tax=Mongoliibacter sp. TaxID=2022438 RepID=UPI0012F1F61E|nr:murein L,D-transpeptidase catalytic domain family protein [Mongoliibacter sp.]TVP52700.1 MAG: hypothetical protein EA341_02700 [Mongoliibacter sp.]
MRITLMMFSLILMAVPLDSNDFLEISATHELKELVFNNKENSNLSLPSPEVLSLAIKGYTWLEAEGKIHHKKPLVVLDFSLPSTEKRIWVIDVESGEILFHDYVSHGKNSGDLYARSFSNSNSSYQSSLGFYLTAETYNGKHGYSLRLDGLEEGINDNARSRAIVIHGAEYANPDFIEKTGRLGRSLGCPALPQESAQTLINLIKENSCLFIYGDSPEYFQNSTVLKS